VADAALKDVLPFLVDASEFCKTLGEDLIKLLIPDYTFSLDNFLIAIPRLSQEI
jgi:hypothetical protein